MMKNPVQNTTSKAHLLSCTGCFLLAGVLWLACATSVRAAITFNSLVSFNNTNGATPTSLMVGADGNLYGTCTGGGAASYGVIFQLATNGAVLNTLTAFTNLSASNYSTVEPVGLGQKSNSTFFGTSFQGGAYGAGTIFSMDSNYTPTIIYSFDYTNGGLPRSGLLRNPNDGNFYGTTYIGGTNGNNGTVFKLTPGGVFSSMFSFNDTNGNSPYAPLAMGPDGYMYGTTSYGGSNGYGSVYRISTAGQFKSLYSFGGTNGANPLGGLCLASNGLFYGTTSQGGSGTHGTIFAVDTNGNLNTIFAFNGTNGATPFAALVERNGILYGTTYFGGTNGNNGTVYSMDANTNFTSLVSFNQTNGASLYNSLVLAGDGSLYGATGSGGTNGGYGTLFQLVFPPAIVPTSPLLKISNNPPLLLFSWNSVSNQTYQLQSTANLSLSNWTNNGPVITATGTNTTTTDTVSQVQLFYRLQVAP